MSEPTLEEKLRFNAELAIQRMKELARLDLSYDAASVRLLSEYIDQTRLTMSGEVKQGMMNLLGSYLGECIRHQFGGTWQYTENGLAIIVNDKFGAFPFNKIRKHFDNGEEDSITSFFNTIPALVNGLPKFPE